VDTKRPLTAMLELTQIVAIRVANASNAGTAVVRSPYAAGPANAIGKSEETTPGTTNANPTKRKLCKRRMGRPDVLVRDYSPDDKAEYDTNSKYQLRRHARILPGGRDSENRGPEWLVPDSIRRAGSCCASCCARIVLRSIPSHDSTIRSSFTRCAHLALIA
jgi:hypothetical protein